MLIMPLGWEEIGLRGAQIGYECMSDGVFFKLDLAVPKISKPVYSYQEMKDIP